jgi:hypothetical protein
LAKQIRSPSTRSRRTFPHSSKPACSSKAFMPWSERSSSQISTHGSLPASLSLIASFASQTADTNVATYLTGLPALLIVTIIRVRPREPISSKPVRS